MDKEKLIPSLRFSGYKDVWEQRKIGECFKERTENMPDGELLSVTINYGIKKFSELGRHDSSNEDKSKYKKVCVGDIAYNSMRMWQGASGYSPYEGIVSPAYTVLSPNEKVDSKCVSYLFKHPDMIHTFQINSQGITSDTWNLKYPALSEIEINLAKDIMEQKEIAAYFSNLDTLITLHQNEYDKLLIMKKAMLEKMFPKNGNKVPEVRFSEFDGAWEYRKLGTISHKIMEKNVHMEFTETFTNSAEYGIISQRDFFDHDIAKQDKINGYYIVRPEDFVYNPRISTTAPVGPIGRNKLGRCGVMSPLYTVFRPKVVDNSFLEQFFKSSHWYSFMRFNGDTGARSDRFSIKDATFFEMPIPFPKVEEQRRIGQYLAGLDVLISLQEKKITKLKNIKAGCLEKMFCKSGR